MSRLHDVSGATAKLRLSIDGRTSTRLLRLSDGEELHALTLRNRDHLQPWMSWMDSVLGIDDTIGYLRSAEREARDLTSFKSGIFRDGALIGCIDLHNIDWNNQVAAIGYWLDFGHTGQGIMTSAVRLLTDYTFSLLALNRLEIRIATGNRRSRAIPERLGYTFEGVLKAAQRLRGIYFDHALYAMLRSDWPRGTTMV